MIHTEPATATRTSGARSSPSTLVQAYAQLVRSKVDDGWSASILTFVFKPIPYQSRRDQMVDEINRVYSTFLTRVVRNPSRPANQARLPILIGSFDLPTFKRDKISLRDARVNGGLHAHAVLLVPPSSRLRMGVLEHFREDDALYRRRSAIARIHVQPIEYDPERATTYVLKAVGNRRLEYDDAMLILPKSATEL